MEPENLTQKGEESVIDEMARMRNEPPPPMTVAEAIMLAVTIRTQPEFLIDPRAAKRVIDTLLSAIEASPCYLKGVREGIPTFVLLATDRAAIPALTEWIDHAAAHGCRAEKVENAMSILSNWRKRPDLRWPT
jgi:hypothetical protein